MKYPFSDKCNIAWFKLAEYAARGEKERAIGIYKLLILTFDDHAFSYQLEGDLLMLFQDDTAIEKYIKSGNLYLKENRLIQAAGVYEHLATLRPENEEYIKQLIDIYKTLDIENNVILTKKRLCKIYIQNNNLSDALKLLKVLEKIDKDLTEIYEQISIKMIKTQNYEPELIIKYLQKSADGYFYNNDHKLLQEMITKLEALDAHYHSKIIEYLKK